MRHMKKLSKKEKRETLAKHKTLILAALDLGYTTRTKIANSAGIKLFELAKIFRDDRKLHARYAVIRRTIVDKAADNIEDIVDDKKHPQHFAASKYVLQTYKSDLDEILESQDEGEIQIGMGNGTSPIRIRFGKKKDKED